MVTHEVSIQCQGATLIDIDDLHEFQGDLKDLSKENYEKLRRDILELGFSEPVSVWKNDGKYFLLNGHQRVRTLRRMLTEGIMIPKIPANLIEAVNEKQAKLKVLSLTSQFGNMTKQGLYEFMALAELEMEDLSGFDFPEINLESFEEEFFKDPPPTGEESSGDGVPPAPQPRCPTCGGKIKAA